jgi:PilX N-terminal
MEDRRFGRSRGERGFALVLAILSLMLLTFLGLTMAATTSTELQIATNYRWSQQALYNAEAGLEAARIALSEVADISAGWSASLPPARTTPWALGAAPAPGGTWVGRDYYKADCDLRGGVGYGLVLVGPGERLENVSDFMGNSLNGAFSVWVRRPLQVDNAGLYVDDTRNDVLVIVSEGVAPYTYSAPMSGEASALVRSRQAVRVLETRFTLGIATAGEPCGLNRLQGQEGGSPMGENFNPCVNLTSGIAGTLGTVFGTPGSGAGELTSDTDVQ